MNNVKERGDTDWVEMLMFTSSNGKSAKEIILREFRCFSHPVQTTSPAQDGIIVANASA